MASAATALQTAGTAYSTYAQYEQVKGQARQAAADSAAATATGQLEATRIRALGQKQLSSANAQAAENGLELGTGVTNTIDDYITQTSEQDAWNSIFNYNNRAKQLNADASNYKKQARSILIAGAFKTGATALQSSSAPPGGAGLDPSTLAAAGA